MFVIIISKNRKYYESVVLPDTDLISFYCPLMMKLKQTFNSLFFVLYKRIKRERKDSLSNS